MIFPTTTRYAPLIALLFFVILPACSNQPSESTIYTPSIPETRGQQIDASSVVSDEWTVREIKMMLDLWIEHLPPLPPDPTNSVADNPQAAALGHRLFFDTRLSANNQVACATCHIPDQFFTDGLPTAHGTRPNPSNTPTIVGTGYAPWLFWNGRNDSLWSQAVAPFEAADEHGYTRLHAIHLIANDPVYRAQYEAVFGKLADGLEDYGRFPDSGGPVAYDDYRSRWDQMTPGDQEIATQIFINLGKSLAAYERLINPGSSRFDAYVAALVEGDEQRMDAALNAGELAGLRLFIGKAHCTQCHNGPLFSDFKFHNTGVPATVGQLPAKGRALGWELVITNEFNCASPYSEGENESCADKLTLDEGDATEDLLGQFRTPTLRNITKTAPYMHEGQFDTLQRVLDHYNETPDSPLGENELGTMDLNEAEHKQIIAFLGALTAPINAPLDLLEPPPTLSE